MSDDDSSPLPPPIRGGGLLSTIALVDRMTRTRPLRLVVHLSFSGRVWRAELSCGHVVFGRQLAALQSRDVRRWRCSDCPPEK